jgi:hypothetical protein
MCECGKVEFHLRHVFHHLQKVIFLLLCLIFILAIGCDGSNSNSKSKNQTAELTTPPSDCFWQIEVIPGLNEKSNNTWPDLNTSYWGAVYTLPQGGSHITIESKFPYSRYMSYSNYYATGGVISTLTDHEIQADLGSVNPYAPGSPRNDPSRIYTLTIQKSSADLDHPANENIMYGADALALLLYRVYLPNSGTDATGNGGVPRVTLHMEDGSTMQGEEACKALNFPITSDDRKVEWYTESEYAGYRDSMDPSKNPPKFRATSNFEFHKQCDFGGDCSSIPPIPLRYPFPDPHYLYSFISRQHGEILILRGKMPETPRTYAGDDNVVEEKELRYWSICNYEYFSQRAEACLFDEQIKVNDDGFYTIVIARQEDKPENATSDCGVSYLAWSPRGDGFGVVDGRENNVDDGWLDIRNLLPSKTFDNVAPTPDTLDEEASMGEYLPKGQYFSKEEFEGLGCNPWLALPYERM